MSTNSPVGSHLGYWWVCSFGQAASHPNAGLQLLWIFCLDCFHLWYSKAGRLKRLYSYPCLCLMINRKKEKGLSLSHEGVINQQTTSSSQLLQGLLLQAQRHSLPNIRSFPGQPLIAVSPKSSMLGWPRLCTTIKLLPPPNPFFWPSSFL